jgi:hypothetical protein
MAMDRALHDENVASAEPAMKRAAARFGAALLPNAARKIPLRGSCDSPVIPDIPPSWDCVSWRSEGGSLVRFQDATGKKYLVVLVKERDADYARVGRAGNRLVLLRPIITRDQVGERTRCQCDGMPHPVMPFSYGFVLDDFPVEGLDVADVSMIEDYVTWHCKEILLQSDPPARTALAAESKPRPSCE